MHIFMIIMGLIIGSLLNILIESVSYSINKIKRKPFNILTPIIFSLCCEVLFLRLGTTVILIKGIMMTAILIVISFVDYRHKIIPDFMVVVTGVVGIIFSFIIKTSILDTALGMICGGGIMFLLSLVPNTMGGGDIKLMFAIGSFLGANKILWALLLAFSISSIVSVILIVFKIKGAKDHIPFGPFLSLGSYISLLIFI